MEIALADRAAAGSLDGWVFFDRGLIDAAAALEHITGKPVLTALGQVNRYHRRVFLAALAGDLRDRSGMASRIGCGLGRIFALARNLSVARLRSLDLAKSWGFRTCRLYFEYAQGLILLALKMRGSPLR